MATSTIDFKGGNARLITLLKPMLSERDFVYLKGLSFSRNRPGCVQMISFSTRQGNRAELCFSFGAGVRFPAVEALLRPDSPDDLVATIAKPLSALKPSGPFPEWCFDGQQQPADIVSQCIVDVDAHAIPFLDRYSSLDQVEEPLRSADPRDWFVLNPEQRLMTLSAIEYLQGRHAEALRRLDDALAEIQDGPLKKVWPLRKLRERLAGGD